MMTMMNDDDDLATVPISISISISLFDITFTDPVRRWYGMESTKNEARGMRIKIQSSSDDTTV